MTAWRALLAGLQDRDLDDTAREAIVARAAVRLAADRAAGGRRPTIEEIVSIAREEFAVIIDAAQAKAARRAWTGAGASAGAGAGE
ncbi:hypothetical protein OG866_00385 [Streptomyces sp. NBC_00663]|uniref:hypothetical protein n=1 Tax=Streptomyces sp. NBC_00663 TaxID=2975801 RepID=UPI002E365CF1|nr:hypothetical protein [Streptomyces sp. NBC_00663]